MPDYSGNPHQSYPIPGDHYPRAMLAEQQRKAQNSKMYEGGLEKGLNPDSDIPKDEIELAWWLLAQQLARESKNK